MTHSSCSGFYKRSHCHTEFRSLTCVVAIICKQDRGKGRERDTQWIHTLIRSVYSGEVGNYTARGGWSPASSSAHGIRPMGPSVTTWRSHDLNDIMNDVPHHGMTKWKCPQTPASSEQAQSKLRARSEHDEITGLLFYFLTASLHFSFYITHIYIVDIKQEGKQR